MASGKVFLAYRPFHPPTGIEHSVFANFTSSGATNLITTTANLLDIHTIHRHEGRGRRHFRHCYHAWWPDCSRRMCHVRS